MSTDGREARRPAGRRHRGRELALRVLFELDGAAGDVEQTVIYQARDMRASGDVEGFGRALVGGATAQAEAVDGAIRRELDNWQLEHLGRVERAVLRLGAYELLFETATPVAVIIDESVELAKTYAGPEAASFVNGVLGPLAAGARV